MSPHGDQAKQINRKLETTLSPIKIPFKIKSISTSLLNVILIWLLKTAQVSKDFPNNVNQ